MILPYACLKEYSYCNFEPVKRLLFGIETQHFECYLKKLSFKSCKPLEILI